MQSSRIYISNSSIREKLEEVIKNAKNKGREGPKMFKVTRKVRNYRIAILKWKNTINGNARKKINDLKDMLEWLSKFNFW